MKIGVFSDSHDNVNMIKEAVDLFNAEAVSYTHLTLPTNREV